MSALNWQQQSVQFAKQHDLQNDPNIHALDLLSELGEVAKELLKGSDYGKTPLQVSVDMPGELGDALYSLCLLADSLDIDLDLALSETLLKYKKRWQTTGVVGSGQ